MIHRDSANLRLAVRVKTFENEIEMNMAVANVLFTIIVGCFFLSFLDIAYTRMLVYAMCSLAFGLLVIRHANAKHLCMITKLKVEML